MLTIKIKKILKDQRGMELVQVGLLIAIAIAIGLIFKTQITQFVKTKCDKGIKRVVFCERIGFRLD